MQQSVQRFALGSQYRFCYQRFGFHAGTVLHSVVRSPIRTRHVSALWSRRDQTDLADDIPNVILNPMQERFQLRLAPLNPLQIGFPLPGHHRALHFGMHYLDQMNTLVGGFQILHVANDVLAFQQHFDDRSPGGRSAEAGLFHRVRKFFLVERFSGCFHRRQQSGFREPLWRTSLLANGFGFQNILSLSALQPGRKRLLFLCVGLFFLNLKVQNLPTYLLNRFSGGMIFVRDRTIHDYRDDSGHRPDVIFMRSTKENAGTPGS